MVRGLEDRPYNGHENNKTETLQRFQRRDRGCVYSVRDGVSWGSGKHNPHYSWCNYRRRRNPSTVSGSLGSGQEDRLGLGPDDPRLSRHLSPDILCVEDDAWSLATSLSWATFAFDSR